MGINVGFESDGKKIVSYGPFLF